MGFGDFLGDAVAIAGTKLGLPEFGIPEKLGAKPTGPTTMTPTDYMNQLQSDANARATIEPPAPTGGDSGYVYGAATTAPTAAQLQAQQDAQTKAQNAAYLNDQMSQLRALLGRTDTALTQGLTRNEDEYNTQYGGASTEKDQQMTSQMQARQSAYNTANRQGANGYRSLAQIIGRGSGTGSSAFRELLPDVVGKDISMKRQGASQNYGQNATKIEDSFSNVIADLLRQKKTNEESLRSGVETQKMGLNEQLRTLQGKLIENNGGNYDAIKAAQAPFQSAIQDSERKMDGLFDTFRTPYTKQAINPNLAEYSTDRSVINAKNQGAEDPANPYASLLRRKLQQQS